MFLSWWLCHFQKCFCPFVLLSFCKCNSLDGNIPSSEDVENLKRLCPWLEEQSPMLRARIPASPKQISN